jgi:predicted dinucleotide-binding enzyme
MKIGVIGTGSVGGTLGRRFAQSGHTVAFGSRKADSPEAKELAAIPNARVTSPQEAAQSSDVLVMATPWPATLEALRGLGDLSGKVLLDVTNPLKPDLSGLTVGTTSSGAEQVAQAAPGARVVKIFNTVGFNIMANPKFGADAATMLYCGDDAAAKSAAGQLATELGFDPVDAGPLTQARQLEPMCMLWVSLAYAAGHGRDIAFKLMHR